MNNNFSKRYDHKELEEHIYNYWNEQGYFKPEIVENNKENNKEESFVIPMPPPNVTGVLHLGHSQMLTIEDIMVRFNRMLGKKTVWIPGTDHAGIATQVVVENKLKEKEGLHREDLGREKFLGKVWDWVKDSRSTITSQIKKMGASCDWSREQCTLSEKLSRAVRKSFSDLYNNGKIYKGTYIVNWCTHDQTVLSDIEVEYKEEEENIYYIRYFIEGKGDAITVATVRPETIFGDVAVAVNPKDKRYKKFIGKNVMIPVINKSIPVIADEGVDISFGTGALKITPTHDPHDYEIGKKHDLPLDQFAIDKDGRLTDLAGEEFAGHYVEDVFENITQYIDEIGNLEKTEKYSHNTPYCERCSTKIQPMVSTQWFVDVKEAANKSIDYIQNSDVNIYPERFNKTFYQWLENIHPWCISRQLRWGHRIPVWYCENNHENIFTEDDIYNITSSGNKILSMIIFNLISDSRLEKPFNVEQLINILFSDSLTPQEGRVYQVYLNTYKKKFEGDENMMKEIEELKDIFDTFKDENINSIVENGGRIVDCIENINLVQNKGDLYSFNMKCKKCEDINLSQDTDVLDTWFSSGLWPFSILGWPEETQDMKNFYPNTVLETGYDIIFFWVARMVMMGYENIGEKPFSNIYLHGLIRDGYGKKMSKSKGNTKDPLEIINDYGSDALRLTLVTGITPGGDLIFSDEKLHYNWRFINKLWNATRYIFVKVLGENNEMALNYNLIRNDIESNHNSLNDFDGWIVNKINDLIEETNKNYEKFMLGENTQSLIQTTWHDFCDWYIEISKLEKSEYTNKVLLYAIGTLLKLLHPYIPFVTEKLWSLLGFEGDLIISDYPQGIDLGGRNTKLNMLMDIISEFRTLRQQADLKPHEKVEIAIQGNSSFLDFSKSYEGVLKSLINAENINYIIENDDIENDYSVSVVADINIGLKVKKDVDWTQHLNKLEKELEEEQQFLQNLRNILSDSSFTEKAPQKVINDKQNKMSEVKEKIVRLEHEINKIKVNKGK